MVLKKWDNVYLRDKIGEKKVIVVVILNGYVDVVLEDKFVMLEEWEMYFFEFLDIFEGKRKDFVIFYV